MWNHEDLTLLTMCTYCLIPDAQLFKKKKGKNWRERTDNVKAEGNVFFFFSASFTSSGLVYFPRRLKSGNFLISTRGRKRSSCGLDADVFSFYLYANRDLCSQKSGDFGRGEGIRVGMDRATQTLFPHEQVQTFARALLTG